ncbi:MAG: ATP-binding cassette domain-containing protein [Gammaproteobacteria bacterium]
MSKDILVQVEHISRYYGPNAAVSQVSFELRRGEVLGFLGPNGAGKSTTMQMITGNLAPSAGRIRICGIDLLDQPKAAKAAIGYLPEQPPLYRDFTVDEYLTFCARINGIAHDQVNAAVQRAKQRCGLTDVSQRLINNLSKGFQQRVGIAQAIIHSPAVVVLDEPTVGLDPIQIREIRSLIRELGNDHGVILSTHILPEVQMTCDRVQIINKGKLVFSDQIENLNQRMQSASLLLGLRQPPPSSELAAISGVNSVEALEAHRFRLFHDSDHSPAEALAELAVQKGWGLLELSPECKTLEQIFVDITSTETQVEEHAA